MNLNWLRWLWEVLSTPEIDPHKVVTHEDPVDFRAELHSHRGSARRGD